MVQKMTEQKSGKINKKLEERTPELGKRNGIGLRMSKNRGKKSKNWKSGKKDQKWGKLTKNEENWLKIIKNEERLK